MCLQGRRCGRARWRGAGQGAIRRQVKATVAEALRDLRVARPDAVRNDAEGWYGKTVIAMTTVILDAKAHTRTHEFDVEDIEYLRHGDKPLLARVFRPRGEGPF